MGSGSSKGKKAKPNNPAPPPVPKKEEEEDVSDDVIPESVMESLFEKAQQLEGPNGEQTGVQEGPLTRESTKYDLMVEDDPADAGITFGLADFPTPEILKESNIRYGELQGLRNRMPTKKPFPVATFKNELFTAEDFIGIDQFALQAPTSLLEGSLEDLVKYLTAPCTTELQKARSLFRWISGQDLGGIDPDGSEQHGMVYIWLQLVVEYKAYDVFYQTLCKHAGIETKLVKGYLKSAAYEIGQTVSQLPKGYWTAIRLDGWWRLVHAHWCLSSISKTDAGWVLVDDGKGGKQQVRQTETGPTKLFFHLDEDYFLADPQQFIYSHIPTEGEKWQLLARPVTYREFTQMAYLRMGFFNYDLKLKSQPKCEVQALNGECFLEFGLPEDQIRSFQYKLYLSSDDEKNLEGITMDKYVFMEQTKELLKCRIVFPVKGKLKFEMYCTSPSADTWEWVCDYIIHCEAPNTKFEPLQDKIGDYWGPNEKARELEVDPVTHPDGVVEAVNGMFEMRFAASKDLEIRANMHNNDKSESEMEQFVLHQRIDDQVVICGKVVERGDNVLEITATDGGRPVHISSYLLTGDHPAFDLNPYPKNVKRLIGETDFNGELQVEPMSHPSGIIQASGELDIVMKTPIPCVLKGILELSDNTGTENMDDFVTVQQTEKQATFKVRISKPGIYSFQIQGKKSETDSFSNVYNYVIEAYVPKEKCFPFPKPLPDWRADYEIIRPTNRIIPSKVRLQVSAKIPDAEKVAVIGPRGKKMSLFKDEKGVWQESGIMTGSPSDDFLLAAVFPGEDKNDFRPLLKYQIEDQNTIDELVEEQAERRREAKEKIKAHKQEVEDRQDEFNKARDDILLAIEIRDMNLLVAAIEVVETKRYIERLKVELAEAKKLLASLENIKRLNQLVKNMDPSHLEALKNTSDPSTMVHDVLQATLLILGEDEKLVMDWKWCQNKMNNSGPDGLMTRIETYDVTSLHPEVAAKAKEILGKYRLDDVRDKSEGAAIFYQWTLGMIDELYQVEEKKKRFDAFIQARMNLILGGKKRDYDMLKKAIINAEKNYPGQLQRELDIAKKYMAFFERVRKMKKKILEMNSGTMSEMRQYRTPQPEVHEVMKATFLLLGDHERRTRKWKRCQKLLKNTGSNGIHKRVKDFDLHSLHPEIAARSWEILQNYQLNQISDKSAGGATFYQWSHDMISEMWVQKPEAEDAPPAGIQRQQEILGVEGEKEEEWKWDTEEEED